MGEVATSPAIAIRRNVALVSSVKFSYTKRMVLNLHTHTPEWVAHSGHKATITYKLVVASAMKELSAQLTCAMAVDVRESLIMVSRG